MEEIGLIVSILTAMTAIIAIFISVIQLNISNRQYLFERRLKAYLNIKWMKSLCDKNKELCYSYIKDAENGPLFAIDFLFINLTNVSYLEGIQGVIVNLLDNEKQREFLLKLEEIKSMCEEIRLIFPEQIGYPLSDFIYYYHEMLISMYKYQIIINRISDRCNQQNISFPINDQLENVERKKLKRNIEAVLKCADMLDLSFINKMKKKIKL